MSRRADLMGLLRRAKAGENVGVELTALLHTLDPNWLMGDMVTLSDVYLTGLAFPVQGYGTLEDGSQVYLRERGGAWSIQKMGPGGIIDGEILATGGEEWYTYSDIENQLALAGFSVQWRADQLEKKLMDDALWRWGLGDDDDED